VIGALGRLVHKKGFDTLIAAMPAVLQARPDAYCIIGGQGDLEAPLRAQIARLGLSERVLLPGHVNWQETPDFCALCQVLAVPSVVDTQGNVDGLPNVLLEALASGCAVVASRVAGIPDVVRDGENGLLVPPGDAAALAGSLCRLLGNAALRQCIGTNAQALMRAGFGWDSIAARYEALYEEARGA
jgi:glycosyltransferase involved in cell wall biosynthesis